MLCASKCLQTLVSAFVKNSFRLDPRHSLDGSFVNLPADVFNLPAPERPSTPRPTLLQEIVDAPQWNRVVLHDNLG
jgi:hypothetical protein